jgi:hypothetical protein
MDSNHPQKSRTKNYNDPLVPMLIFIFLFLGGYYVVTYAYLFLPLLILAFILFALLYTTFVLIPRKTVKAHYAMDVEQVEKYHRLFVGYLATLLTIITVLVVGAGFIHFKTVAQESEMIAIANRVLSDFDMKYYEPTDVMRMHGFHYAYVRPMDGGVGVESMIAGRWHWASVQQRPRAIVEPGICPALNTLDDCPSFVYRLNNGADWCYMGEGEHCLIFEDTVVLVQRLSSGYVSDAELMQDFRPSYRSLMPKKISFSESLWGTYERLYLNKLKPI